MTREACFCTASGMVTHEVSVGDKGFIYSFCMRYLRGDCKCMVGLMRIWIKDLIDCHISFNVRIKPYYWMVTVSRCPSSNQHRFLFVETSEMKRQVMHAFSALS